MRVLVACEFSGVVRDAFMERGHTTWSWQTGARLGIAQLRKLFQDY